MRNIWSTASAVAVAACTVAALTPGASVANAAALTPGSEPPMVTLLFSRSELGDAADCSDTRAPDTVWLATTVAPLLKHKGFAPTGTLETTTTQETTRSCLHYGRTLAMSWADAAYYRDKDGWSFISHGRTRVDLTTTDDATLEDQVAGSLQDLEDHGHTHASGMYAYQNNKYNDHTQAVVRKYYDFGRTYRFASGPNSITTHAVSDPERYQWTAPAGGGACIQKVAACTDNVYTTVNYTGPAKLISALNALHKGGWLTIQSYVFVTGYRPQQWDCRSSDGRLHWTFDAERYCWSDYVRFLDALSARSDIKVTDPYAVARTWYPGAAARPAVPAGR